MRQRLKRCWFIGTVILIALPPFAASATEPVRSVDIVEASAFLEGYRAASEAHSVDFYDLYSDRAVVHVRIQDHERGVAFQGRAFKAWGRQLLTEGRSAPDSSIFHEATVEQRGTRLLIRAKRYSTAKCYWDLSYQVGIEREGTSYRIVDERLTTQPTASCRSTARGSIVSGSTASVTPSEYTAAPMSGSAPTTRFREHGTVASSISARTRGQSDATRAAVGGRACVAVPRNRYDSAGFDRLSACFTP